MKILIPKHVKGEARRVWKRLAAIVGDRLDELTVISFDYLVSIVLDYAQAAAAVQGLNDRLVVKNANGTQSVHPLEKIRHQRSVELRAALKEWGLTPASIHRIGAATPAREQDEQEAFEKL